MKVEMYQDDRMLFVEMVGQKPHWGTPPIGLGLIKEAPIEENTSWKCIRTVVATCGCKILITTVRKGSK